VLRVISSSPGELQPVFEAMLESAVRVCEASFGNLLLYDGSVFRHVALHNAPQAWAAEQQRDPVPPNLAVILPISGRTLWSNIAGIRCTDRGCVVFRASGAHRVSWCTWS